MTENTIENKVVEAKTPKKRSRGRPTKAQAIEAEDQMFDQLLVKRAERAGLTVDQLKAAMAMPADAGRANRPETDEARAGSRERDDAYMDDHNKTLNTDGMDPNFTYRWVHDHDKAGSKILDRMQRGWTMVDAETEQITVGHMQTSEAGGRFGSCYRKSAGTGGTFLFLMRIHNSEMEKIEAAKKQRRLAVDDGIWGNHAERDAFYGKVTTSQGRKTD